MMRFTIIYNILCIFVLINVIYACKKIQLHNNTQMNLRHSPVCLTSSCNHAGNISVIIDT